MASYTAIRELYRKNAIEMTAMLASGKYRGRVLTQLTEARDRAATCATMTDEELRAHLQACGDRVTSQLAHMLTR